MRAELDLAANAMYIVLRDDAVASTVQIDAATLVDVASDGSVRGLEVLNPSRNWLGAVLERFADGITAPDRAMLLALYGGDGATEGYAIVRPTVEMAVLQPC